MASSTGLNMGPVTGISIADAYGAKQASSSLPNKKVNLSIHQANGGYIVEITNNGYAIDSELYIISEDKDLGQEIGKIITHNKLKT